MGSDQSGDYLFQCLLQYRGLQCGPGIEKTEAGYRLDEFLDAFESKLDNPVIQENGNIGEFCWSGDQDFPGFELSFENHPVHMVEFSR